jgi:hypothetical protein
MTPPSDAELFDTPLLTCWWGTDGILYSKSKVAERSLENYDKLFEIYKKLSDNGAKKIRTLGDITKTSPLSKEVREHLAQELPKYISAMALISDSPTGKTIGNFFIGLTPQPYPTKMFNDEKEGATWLSQFKDE